MINFIQKYKMFNKINIDNDVIVYLEYDSDWNHMSNIIDLLLLQKKVLIINSGKNTFIDYSNKYKNLKVINIDSGIFRTFIFNYLKSEVVFLSITDLNNCFLWKSKFVKKYVYVFHSITSTHMCYTEKSFDNYDCLLCTGSHQFIEIRERKIK